MSPEKTIPDLRKQAIRQGITNSMSEDLEKQKEILDPVQKPDSNLTRTESIKTNEQHQDHTKALVSNPDQFPSIANLAIPNKDKIEPFQIIDAGKTIASSRKVEKAEQSQPAGNPSFHEGLKALPEGASPAQLAQYQTEYILRKAASTDAAGTMQALNPTMMLEGRVEKTQTTQETNEYYERMSGFLIGSVQGIGSVAVGLAEIADFAAYVLLEDRRAGLKIEQFCQSLSKTILAGSQLFNSTYEYLYNIGFEGDYSKPFSDIARLSIILNDRWNQLPPREQERRKAELISQLITDGLVGMAGAQSLGKAKTFTELLDGIATKGINKAGQATKKLSETIGRHVDDLLQSEYALPSGGKIKMRDLNPITKEDLALKMEGQRPSKAFRGDDNFKSKFDKSGYPKSHINEAGDLVPADITGLFNGRPVDIIEHICDVYFREEKAHSPFTSLSVSGEIATIFGNKNLTVNLEYLRAAINDESLIGTELIEHLDLLKLIDKSQFDSQYKKMAILLVHSDKEMLVKGPIPARFLEIHK